MLNCNVCGKETYVDGNAECSECARLRGYDDIEVRRLVVALRDVMIDGAMQCKNLEKFIAQLNHRGGVLFQDIDSGRVFKIREIRGE